MGYRFGFVGGGDIHDGRPGDELYTFQDPPEIYKNLYRQGITAVIAKSLSRKEVFDALYNRRCYATSNIRMIADFSINEASSGSILKNFNNLYFQISGASEIPINNAVIITHGKHYREIYIRKHKFEIEFEQSYNGEKYFYVRLEREDGELTWLTPIFIES